MKTEQTLLEFNALNFAITLLAEAKLQQRTEGGDIDRAAILTEAFEFAGAFLAESERRDAAIADEAKARFEAAVAREVERRLPKVEAAEPTGGCREATESAVEESPATPDPPGCPCGIAQPHLGPDAATPKSEGPESKTP